MIDVSTKKSRAIFYSSTEWKRLRQRVLERDHYEQIANGVEQRVD
jgi:hypothetical protein